MSIPAMMRAVVMHAYGAPDKVLTYETNYPTPQPENLKPTEVLVEVHAASLNAADYHMVRGDPALVRLMAGWSRPKNEVRGSDIAGVVVAVGSAVTSLRVGDEVIGDTSLATDGAFAEYCVAPQDRLAIKPENLSMQEAAALPMACSTALQGLRDVLRVQPGERLLVNGASGGVGVYAVQLAKAMGAHVTAVCSTRNVEQTRSLGADVVIDYTAEDVFAPRDESQQFDAIIDMALSRSLRAYVPLLKTGGRYALIGGPGLGEASIFMRAMIRSIFLSLFSGRTFSAVNASPNARDLSEVAKYAREGKVRPLIDRHLPLDQVPQGILYLETKRCRSKVIIDIKQQ